MTKGVLLDTNALIYHMEGRNIMLPYQEMDFWISVVSEIEIRSKKNLSMKEEKQILNVVSDCVVCEINHDVKEIAIALRRTYGLKLADSLIAASAWYHRLPIVTADKVFIRIEELNVFLLEL